MLVVWIVFGLVIFVFVVVVVEAGGGGVVHLRARVCGWGGLCDSCGGAFWVG